MASYYDRKDYSRPLHVDCSVEYELPNAAKPPAGARTEPLLMIHPCYYRRAESQRRSPFINNLPATRGHYPHPPVQPPPPPRYTASAKRDPLLCGSSGDSGVSVSGSGVGGQWPDTSPAPLRSRLGPDSGIVDDKAVLTALTAPCWEAPTEPTSARLYGPSRCQTSTDSNRELRDTTNQTQNHNSGAGARHSWAITSDFLSMPCTEVNNNNGNGGGGGGGGGMVPVAGAGGVSKAQGPAVGVAAVAACKACQPQFLHPQQQRTTQQQQPWPAVTPTSRHRTRAVEPGPEHGASSLHRRPPPAWPAPPAKRARQAPACCKVCTQWNYPHCRVTDDNSRVLWNNDTMLRLYQV